MKIIIIDDDRLISMSLKMIIEAEKQMEVAAIGVDGNDVLPLYQKHQPDIVLMDIRMQSLDGLSAGQSLLEYDNKAKIIFLTTFADDEYIIKAIRMGARGYILKQNYESLITALYAVEAGQSVFGDDIVAKIPSLMSNQKKLNWLEYDLKEREIEIIKMVAQGLNNKEIANSLFLGEGTVRNSISIILEKMNLRDRTQLAIWYYKKGSRQE